MAIGAIMKPHDMTFKGYLSATVFLFMVALNFFILAFGSGAWAGNKDGDVWIAAGLWSICIEIPSDAEPDGT